MTLVSRVAAGVAAAAVCALLLAGAATPVTTAKNVDKLLILSTSDVKGKTSPCG